jgi:hypothetical protein
MEMVFFFYYYYSRPLCKRNVLHESALQLGRIVHYKNTLPNRPRRHVIAYNTDDIAQASARKTIRERKNSLRSNINLYMCSTLGARLNNSLWIPGGDDKWISNTRGFFFLFEQFPLFHPIRVHL